ncbi:LSU ribosomal protein L22P [Archaeoglobus sulfaticallidus PM70-1]|uniref:Large ribosomal subunit protein uL22 n=1 Tax=Archaeoglobus sulfaticallidus PM70-1 TaxID=387631 RepID=N0B962_9EURY|nr:50S ribosomal protein L22 [Archaeoglobus sulfaticallidus]AGK60159.1 LSU ribosomal protein L22P [Archaeoglobus sulfaticallidus PM70-1]
MARVRYAYEPEDPTKAAKAMGYEMPISFKHAVEICSEIKGMKIDEAIRFLEEVAEMKRAVRFKKYYKKVGHKSGLDKWFAGRYPQKAARYILKVIKNLEANADYKGIEKDRLIITHAQAKKGRVLKRFTPRAFGRATPKFKTLTTVEFVAEVR